MQGDISRCVFHMGWRCRPDISSLTKDRLRKVLFAGMMSYELHGPPWQYAVQGPPQLEAGGFRCVLP